MYSGQFMHLRKELLNNQNVEVAFNSIFQNFKFDSKNENNENESKENENKEDEMFQQLKSKLYTDFVSGAFNRYSWGYLKQIKPDKGNNLSIRNRLKLNFKTATPFSSLQVN